MHSSNSTYKVAVLFILKQKKLHIFISYDHSHININSLAMLTGKKDLSIE